MEDIYNVPFKKDLELTIYFEVGSAWRVLDGRHHLDALLQACPRLQDLLVGEDLFTTATVVSRLGGSRTSPIQLLLKIEVCHLYQSAEDSNTLTSLRGQLIDAFLDAAVAYNENLFPSASQKKPEKNWEPYWKIFRNAEVNCLIKRMFIFDDNRLVIKKVPLPD